MPWDNVPEDKWPDMESCVTKVMADGKDKDAATAICYDSVMGKKKESRLRQLATRLADSITAVFAEAETQAETQAEVTPPAATIVNNYVVQSAAEAATVADDLAAMQALDGAQARALPMLAVYEQVFMAAYKRYPMAYVLDLYTEAGGAMYAVLAQEGKLYRSEVSLTDGTATLGEWQQVEVDFSAAPAGEMRAADDPIPGRARVQMVRQKDGRVRWFSQSCSAVLNRSGEIDGTALFDSFIRHAEETGEYPIRQFFHAGEGFKTGQADWLARDGFIYLTSGLFDDSEIARAEIAAREREPEYWGESIGYDATAAPIMVDVGGGVKLPLYTEGIHREISTLPEKDAAAIFTRTAQEVRRMTQLSQRQLDELIHLFGDEDAARKWLADNPEATNRQIAAAALVARATPPPAAAGAATAEAEAATDETADDETDESEDEATAEAADDETEESEDGDGDGSEAETERQAEAVLELTPEDMDALAAGVMDAPAMRGLFDAVQSIQASLAAMSEDATAHRMRDTASLDALAARMDGLDASHDEQRSVWQDDLPMRRRVAVSYRPRADAGSAEPPALDMAAEAEAVTESFPS